MKLTPLIAAAALLLAPVTGFAQSAAAPPPFVLKSIVRPAEPDAIPLYPGVKLPQPAVAESWGMLGATFPDGTHMEARIARNVSVPTITPVLPDPAKATGAAVIVAPGGAFLSLSMDSEGFQIAHWLADHGIAAFVLKYRLNPTPAADQAFMATVNRAMGAAMHADKLPDMTAPYAAQDALQAIKLVRDGASRWKIDPSHVGMIGFSAGAMTTLQAVLTGQGAARPSFFGFIYGPMTAVDVPAGASPMFAALAMDDPLMGGRGFGIVDAWHKAGLPVELHVYEHGGHGFGLGHPGTTTMLVLDEFRLWLETNGWLSAAVAK